MNSTRIVAALAAQVGTGIIVGGWRGIIAGICANIFIYCLLKSITGKTK